MNSTERSGRGTWEIPVNKSCGDYVTIVPTVKPGIEGVVIVAINYVEAVIDICDDNDGDGHHAISSTCPLGDDCDDNDPTVYPGAPEICGNCKDNNCDGKKDENCCKIESFGGLEDYKTNPQLLDPINGANLTFTGSISGTCDYPVTWTVKVPETNSVSIPGGGSSISATWDGKMSNGEVVEEGSHTAELTASTEVCPDMNKNSSFTVKRVCDMYETSCCQLQVIFGSSANIASGNLSHSQPLFTVPNSKILGDFALSYNSLDLYSGPLGKGWTHSYNIALKAQGDVAILREADGKQGMLYNNGDSYTPRNLSYPRLTKNTDGTYSLLHKDGIVYSFDQSGKITAIADRNNNTANFGYDANGNLLTATGSSGKTTTFTYDGNNRLASVLDPMGNLHTMSYTGGFAAAVITQTADGETKAWTYTYDSGGYMLSKTDPAGNVTAYTYDADHRALTSTGPEGKVKGITYPTDLSSSIRTATVTEKDGGVWTYTYDLSGMTLNSKTDPEGNATSYTYDANGNRLSTTEPDGTVTLYTYETENNMTSSTDAEGNTTYYTYNDYGQVTSLADPEGRITAYAYDSRGNMTSVTDPAGAITVYEYDSKGNVISITDSEGRVTTYSYDAAGFMSSITDATGATTSFTYDAAGNTATTTGLDGNTSHFKYDGMNRLLSLTDAQGNASSFTYDLLGNKTSSTDANGNTTWYEYNYRGQVTKVTDAMGGVTTYTYGGTGCPSCGGGTDKLTSLTDAKGNITLYEYDLLGRLTKETDPEGNVITYSYDSTGNLLSKTDASGITIDYIYDDLRRLTNIDYPDSSENISYTYDTSGKILTMTDQSGVMTYIYDNSNRLIYETKTIDGISYATSYTYTAGGALSSVSYPSGRTVTYNQDAFGRPAKVTETKDSSIKDVIKNITYNTNGTVSTITYGNGLVTTKGYDVKGVLNSMNIGTLKSLSYMRDNVGNITSIIDNLDPAKSKSYAYDNLYRLTQAAGPWGTIQYNYDPIGNRTVETAGAGVTNYVYAANKLQSSTGVKSFTFGYDNNGNTVAVGRLQKTERSYIYNQNQRLIKATENNKTLGEYVYNGNGQRVKKTVNGKTTYFFYDQSGNLIEEADGEGKPLSDYIYLGGTPIGRVDTQNDILPPVTTAAAGEPKYETTGGLFVSGATSIILSAIDEGVTPSGVDYTEYRIDNKAFWTRYTNSFSLGGYSDGIQTVSYRSMDKAGNLEDAKMLTVIFDTLAPVSGILIGSRQYQTGNDIYIGGSTPIRITASDSGSGVGKIEYAVDGGPYATYMGPFTLYGHDDGTHSISFHSVDNVLNAETEKTTTVVLDKTPPSTTISASDPLTPGVTNTVSPNTIFSFSSEDELSGVNKIQYRLDGGNWNTYYNGFGLTSGAGPHTIGYKATDNAGNDAAEESADLRLVVIDINKAISTDPVVLAGAWGSTPDTQTAIANLTSILSASGLSYYIPQTEEEFKASLRNGRYNTYLLVDFKTEGLVDELREAVNYGDGLVYIKTIPDTIPSLADVFGVKFNGMSTNKELTVDLAGSEISEATTLLTMGKVVKTTITAATAESLGTVTDKKETYPVIVTNLYGRGKVILFAFDLLSSSEAEKVRDLIVNSIKYVAPAEQYTRALSNVPVSISIKNSTEPADVQITESLPLNTSVDTVIPSATTSDNTITWQFNVGASGRSPLSYWLMLPDMAGDYQLGTELKYSNQGNYRLYGNCELSVNVFQNSSELLSEVIAELEALSVSKSDAAHTNNAIGYMNQVRDYSGITKPDAQANIDNILNALKELEKVSVDISAIRLKIDELLKIWQAKWSLTPDVVSHLSRYKLAYETDARRMIAISPYPSFPRTVVGNPASSCKTPIVLASTGSVTQLLNTSTTNDVLYFYHTDHLGTPILMTDINGTKVWEGEFLPFGEEYSITGTLTNNLRFPGQYYDEETGLHQNWHRDYRSETGSYIEFDPKLKGVQQQTSSCQESQKQIGTKLYPYVYTINNPINFDDPRGLDCPGCDMIGSASPCYLECCAQHDRCYDVNNCSAWSWGPGGSAACDKCNEDVENCYLACRFGNPNADDPNLPNYYCRKKHKFIKIPGDFSDLDCAKKECCN